MQRAAIKKYNRSGAQQPTHEDSLLRALHNLDQLIKDKDKVIKIPSNKTP